MSNIEFQEYWEDPIKKKFVEELLTQILEKLTKKRLEEPEELSKLYLNVLQRLSKKYKILLGKAEIHKYYQLLIKKKLISPSFILDSLTKTKSVRSRSGILPISLATDGNHFSCAYDCYYCPDESIKKGAPRNISRSYLSSEGTFIRGAIEEFEPAGQIWRRLLELEVMGHPPDKLEMILLGGTWDSFDLKYREYFIHQIFYACNCFSRISIRMKGDLSHLTNDWIKLNPFKNGLKFDSENKIKSLLRPINSLDEEKIANEFSNCSRIIGIVLETRLRPDQINKNSLKSKRQLGCTRIQLGIGIQHTDNEILALINRGHNVKKTISAIQCARDACFKIDGHLMPDLPGTTFEKDLEMFKKVFGGDELQLDYCKLYPCLDLPYTVTREWKQTGIWKPMAEYDFKSFLDLLRISCAMTPPWTRINRVHRDFPEASKKNSFLGFTSENIKSNLQQYVNSELEKHGQKCFDIRSREIKNAFPLNASEEAKLFIRTYRANGGTEFFLSVEIPRKGALCLDDAVLMGLLRLRITDYSVMKIKKDSTKAPFHFLPEFIPNPMALIRELHVYGNIEVNKEKKDCGNSQHTGVGKFLMAVAERISRVHHINKLIVISGVGVRGYYKKLGYTLEPGVGEYFTKNISNPNHLLPLRLFNRTLNEEYFLIPISYLKIPKRFLPIKSIPLFRYLKCCVQLKTWYSITEYSHIQSGEAQLLIIDASTSFIDIQKMFCLDVCSDLNFFFTQTNS